MGGGVMITPEYKVFENLFKEIISLNKRMTSYIITNDTGAEILEKIFFKGARRLLRNLTYENMPVSIECDKDTIEQKLETIRLKRKRENGRRCYEKHRESRLERERSRYHQQKCGPYEPKPSGRPKVGSKENGQKQ